MRVHWLGAIFLAGSASVAFAQAVPVQTPDEAQLYEIDAEASEVYWLVYRGPGALSQRFGHNHVVSVGDIAGQVLLSPELEQSRFELEIPVEALVVDDPELRAREGDEFTSAPSADDVVGTRRNMLSDDVLDAANYPVVRVTGVGPAVEAGEQRLEVTFELLGRLIPFIVPTSIEVDGDLLQAEGTFRLTHEELGMRPFSVMMGALTVGEPLDFVYRVVARRVE